MSDTDATQARQDVVVDVDEILEHVINANMLSMPYDVYVELFDAVAGLEVEIENLQAENAKLRELVRDMLMCLTWQYEPHSYMCDGCDCCRFRGKTSGMCGLGQFRGRARELGIEVDE